MSRPTVHHAYRPVSAEHGVVCALPGEFYGYFGWPSVARLTNGDLVVVASGFRNEHVDPFGRTVLVRSTDEGRSWLPPQVINDLPIDDRDAGIVDMGGGALLVTWFTSDTRRYAIAQTYRDLPDPAAVARYEAGFRRLTEANLSRWLGSWTRLSEDHGDTWQLPIAVPVTAPHGPIWIEEEQALIYLGKTFTHQRDRQVKAYRSDNRGHSWHWLGTIPLHPGTVAEHYHEPHLVALDARGQRLLGLIRIQNHGDAPPLEHVDGPAGPIPHFSMMQTRSEDGGRTWSTAQPLGFHGAPPHLLRHSSGALVAVYGHRIDPFGEHAMVSFDEGASWDAGYVLDDAAPAQDLGYPASAELPDGSIFTVYYQKQAPDEPCSLLWARWRLDSLA